MKTITKADIDTSDTVRTSDAPEPEDYHLFTFTTTELAGLLWAFSRHVAAISKEQTHAGDVMRATFQLNDAINTVIDKLASAAVEGLTMGSSAFLVRITK